MRAAVLSTSSRPLAVLAVLLGVLAAAAPPAAAHTQLTGSSPEPGATVPRLSEIRLEFRGPLATGDRHGIRLLGPDGARWDDGSVRVAADRTLAVEVSAELPERGEYTVRWCAATADGHLLSGAYKFSYAGPTSASARPAALQTGGGGCAAATPTGVASLTGWVLVGTIAAAVLFLAVTALGRWRRHTRG